jgi:signal transduction histidine kinase
LRHRDGTYRWIQARGEVLRNAEGNPGRMLGCHVDITARKQAEEALRMQQQQLEEIVEARTRELRETQAELLREEKLATLGRLAGGVGHELRNPLGVIKNAVYFLNMTLTEPTSEVRETLEIVSLEVAASERIIRSLFDYADPRAPKVYAGLNLSETIQSLLSIEGIPSHVDLSLRLADDLPAIQGDAEQLELVFRNLIRNAVQAMPTGGRLSLSADGKPPGWVRFHISDTGEGIDEKDRDRIFEPLFTTRAKGIGLGLALCKTYVTGHRGHIEVESEKGRGTTVTVILPVQWNKEDLLRGGGGTVSPGP